MASGQRPRRGEPNREPVPPTLEQFSKYHKAWQWFNAELFGGTLKPCLLNFSSHRGSFGYFCPRRWKKGDHETHEISLNPNMLGRPLEDTMATLAHEMAHQWQDDYGSPSRKGYHNSEWADKMEEIGLIPSDTGEPGGARTGQRMTHYIDPDGKFAKALKAMPKEYALPWLTGEMQSAVPKPKPPKKVKFTCPDCEQEIWSENPELDATCNDCDEKFLTKEELRERKEDEHDD
jgi:DNA-directed RNA polymerase subunit RPC12/RpoP